jgi:hypothetical protein
MKKISILLACILLWAPLTGCEGILTGSGTVETKQYEFSDFTRVDISNAFEFEIVQSSSYSVNITADNNLFKDIQVSKEGETLKVGLSKVSLRWPLTLKVAITMPQLRNLDISGAAQGTLNNFSSTRKLGIEVSGASSLELFEISASDVIFEVSGASKANGDMKADNADFDISGASLIQLEGSAKEITVDASGASHVKLAGFTVDNADITLSGASNATINLEGKLDADLSGASKLEYIGKPTMGDIKKSDASTIAEK